MSVAHKAPSYFPHLLSPTAPPALTWLRPLLSLELVWSLQAFLRALSSSSPRHFSWRFALQILL